jgi:hypothetical protein
MLNILKLDSSFASVAKRLFLVATSAIFCATQLEVCSLAQTQDLLEYSDAEGYAVLSALLSGQQSAKGPVFLISPQTTPGLTSESLESCKSIPAEFKTATEDFQLRNKHPWKIRKQFNLPFEYEIADPGKKPADPPILPGEQPLDIPQPPIYAVSAVGFDPSRSHALVYFAGYAGPEAAGGGYYLFVKNKYGWGVAKASPVCEWMTQEMNITPARRFS